MNEALAAVYARIPKIECKGLCSRACGPIVCEVPEAQATGAPYIVVDVDDWGKIQDTAHETSGPVSMVLVETARRKLASFGMDKKMRCNVLHLGRCTAYENRPGICRLWGVVETMPCHMGCIPERWLTYDEGKAILEEIRQACAA